MESNREFSEAGCTLQKDVFDYFEKLLSPAFVMIWQLIAREEAEGADYISLTSTKSGLTRGRDFTSLSPYYFHFVELVAPHNLAERLCYYMTTNMILKTDKDITIKMSVGRVIKLNNALALLPCLKHKEGAPTVMSAMNVKYTEIKICIIVLNAVNLNMLTAFYAAVQNEFPTDITKLTLQLTRVCNQNKEHKRLLSDLASRRELKSKVGPGNQASMNSATEAIHRKTEGNGKYGGKSPATVRSDTRRRGSNDAKGWGCALCKKYLTNSPNTWKTHPTTDCKK